MTDHIFTRYGGRRFLLCVGCAAINTILFAWGTLSESGYLLIVSGTVVAYITGNVAQRAVQK